jgi:hypothetical protein
MSPGVVFMVLSAATVIIAASLVPDFEVAIEPESSYGNAIMQAFQVLEGHQWQIEGAQGARRLLETFMDTVKQAAEYLLQSMQTNLVQQSDS